MGNFSGIHYGLVSYMTVLNNLCAFKTFWIRATLIGAILCSFVTPVFAEDDAKFEPFTFVQLCDTQLGMGGYEHDIQTFRQAVKQINEMDPDFVVICGDLVNTANDTSFVDFKTIKSDLTVACYCAPGNHDVGKPDSKALKRYRETIGEDYFSLKHKGYTFVFTNTQLWKAPLKGESEKHAAWVAQTLSEAKQNQSPVMMVGHFPLFVKKPDEKETYYNLPLETRHQLLDLYKQNGVLAVLAGHTHTTIINDYDGMQLVNGEVTSKSFDKRPLGFRLWTVESLQTANHEFVPLTNQFEELKQK
ncbi:cyclic 3',5'-adenosine monophosphate phosphodiesterase [Symmachiella dynata]|uniref:Cyclic 3',5'-adenosine monophosphate phosphodiesterase n=1 Tax=Symmachiella dynata TaxID=2527995 RepID=A0A517ZTD2_9PLAN|nr:metallophosphoesterase [Symmachiella dynata]QDU45714.1 cyclic 3',5'-adenosine monophosphate phosphodiesterase [Symmachiella dynata]